MQSLVIAATLLGPPVAAGDERAPEPPPVYRAPTFPEPRHIAPRPSAPPRPVLRRYTVRPPLVRTALRAAPGFSGRLTGRPYAAFSFDVLASVMFGLHGGPRQLGLAPEIGYSVRAPGLDHDLLAGLGIVHGINVEFTTFGLLPRFVYQQGPDGAGIGARTGLWLDFAENGFSIEVAHQLIHRPDGITHQLHATVGLDVLMLVFFLSKARLEWF